MEYESTPYDWGYFKQAMAELFGQSEFKYQPMLELVGECDAIVGEIVDRPLSYAGERPQDYVASFLAVRSFRLCIAAIQICLCGYSETAPNLTRTIHEIGLRLLLMERDPVAASLGFLLCGTTDEIRMLEADIEFRRNEGVELGNLETNLETMRDHEDTLRGLISSRDLEAKELLKRYGWLRIRRTCKELGIEPYYDVHYSFLSGHAHGTDLLAQMIADWWSSPGEMKFILSPTPEQCLQGIFDALHPTVGNLLVCATIIGSEGLAEHCRRLMRRLHRTYHFCLAPDCSSST